MVCVVMPDKEYPEFREFANEPEPFEGDKQSIDTILNIRILIINFRIGKSKYHDDRDYATIQFENGSGNKQIVFTGSEVLMNQLKRYKDKIPFHTTIIKINKYYTMS